MCDGSTLDPSPCPLTIPRDDLLERTAFTCEKNVLLVVEKDAVFQVLVQQTPLIKARIGPCGLVLVTVHKNAIKRSISFEQGKGYPDLATIDFLHGILKKNRDRSALVGMLVDWDPHGLDIYLHYVKKLEATTTNNAIIRYLGLAASDIAKYNDLSQKMLPLKPIDQRKIDAMLKRLRRSELSEDHLVINELLKMNGWKAELELMTEHAQLGRPPKTTDDTSSSQNSLFVRYVSEKIEDAIKQTCNQ